MYGAQQHNPMTSLPHPFFCCLVAALPLSKPRASCHHHVYISQSGAIAESLCRQSDERACLNNEHIPSNGRSIGYINTVF